MRSACATASPKRQLIHSAALSLHHLTAHANDRNPFACFDATKFAKQIRAFVNWNRVLDGQGAVTHGVGVKAANLANLKVVFASPTQHTHAIGRHDLPSCCLPVGLNDIKRRE
jgi:hypothetical protein